MSLPFLAPEPSASDRLLATRQQGEDTYPRRITKGARASRDKGNLFVCESSHKPIGAVAHMTMQLAACMGMRYIAGTSFAICLIAARVPKQGRHHA